MSKYIRKIIQVSVYEASIPCQRTLYIAFLKTVSQKALYCISAHIHFKKISGGMPPDSPRKLVALGH